MFDIDEPKTKGLGRGLNALFEDAEVDVPVVVSKPSAKMEAEIVSAPGRKRTTLGIDQLGRSQYQPRRIFHDESLDELAASIREVGILQPLLVREVAGAPGVYDIVAGERRWHAAQKAGLHEVPVIILEISDLEAFKIALIENLQREDLDPIDEAWGYQRLQEEYGQSLEELGRSVGKSRPHISNMLRLLQLPEEVRIHLSAGNLSIGHARALITAPDPESLAKDVITKGLSVRQTEKLAAEAQGRRQYKQAPRGGKGAAHGAASVKDPDTLALEKDMTNALGMSVTIDSADGRSGIISVEFKSLDQLDEVLHRLAHHPGSRLSG